MSLLQPAPMPSLARQPDAALRIGALTMAVLFVGLLNFVPLNANDIWLQIKIGQLIVQEHAIPQTVLFPFTWVRDYPFHAHEWLPSLLFYGLDEALGHDKLLLAQGALALAQLGLCTLLARRLSGSLGLGLLLGSATLLLANYRYHLRPEIIALLLLVILLWILMRYRQTHRWQGLGLGLPVALLWANCHGSFILAPIMAALFALGEGMQAGWLHPGTGRVRLRMGVSEAMPYLALGLAMLLCSACNPMGFELIRFAFTLSTSAVNKALVFEWAPTLSPFFVQSLAFRLFVAALLLTAIAVFLLRRQLIVTDVLLLAAFTSLAFVATRYVTWYGFVASVVCARLIGAWQQPMRAERVALLASVGLSSLGLAWALAWGNVNGFFPFHAASNAMTAPMVQKISEPSRQGNVFNSYELGAELIYRAYPRLRPSMDSRSDSYGDDYFLLQLKLLQDEDLLNQFIQDFDVRHMLLLWRDTEHILAMKSIRCHWQVVLRDQKMLLLERVNTIQGCPQ